jgi:anion-transporting  ArsA/GET3 family ATPase
MLQTGDGAVFWNVVLGLLDRRLVFVTGKGGVGKSTVAIALGLVGARRGLRTIVVELASQTRVGGAFEPGAGNGAAGGDGGSRRAHGERLHERELAERLYTISIDPQDAMEEYLRIKTGPLGHALGSTRLFQAFAMATPGMRELLSMGKVWELAQLERRTPSAAPYDLVVVDAPATGHGVGILRTPRTFADIARVGPIAHQGRTIAATIADPSFTAVVAVATPEEMPVSETLLLADALEQDDLRLEGVIVNALYADRFTAADVGELDAARGRVKAPAARSALTAALSEHARRAAQRDQLARLRNGLGSDPIELPLLFVEQVGREELELLADHLEAGLGMSRTAEALQQ